MKPVVPESQARRVNSVPLATAMSITTGSSSSYVQWLGPSRPSTRWTTSQPLERATAMALLTHQG